MQAQLEKYQQEINLGLGDLFNSDAAKLGLELKGFELDALELLAEFCQRPGKRVRGALGLFSYRYFSGKDTKNSVNLALAIELIQNYLLIVDDVMDRSLKRRGKPTIHQLVLTKLGNDEHMSNMMAVNIGLLALHIAEYLVDKVDEKPERVVNANIEMNRNIITTVYGQIDDLINDFKRAAKEEDVLRIMEYKVSYYTFINPLQLGACLAGRDSAEVIEDIKNIGRPAGIAFQMQDDILGLFGDPDTTGKSASDDLKEGKYTLLMIYTMELATQSDAAKVKKALGNPNLSDQEYQQIKSIVESCGARAKATDQAMRYADLAQQAIAASRSFDNSAKTFLSDLVEYGINRKH